MSKRHSFRALWAGIGAASLFGGVLVVLTILPPSAGALLSRPVPAQLAMGHHAILQRGKSVPFRELSTDSPRRAVSARLTDPVE